MDEAMKTDWCVDCTHLGRCAQCDGIGHNGIPPQGYRRIGPYGAVKVPFRAVGTGIKETYRGLRHTRQVWKQQRAVLVKESKVAMKEVRRGLYHTQRVWNAFLVLWLKEAKELFKAGIEGIHNTLSILF